MKKNFNPLKYEFVGKERPYLFLIVWDDHNATIDSNWQQLKDIEAPRPIKVRTVGWVVQANDECIAVVPTISEGGQNFGSFSIIKRAIVSAKKLNDGPKWSQGLELKNALHRSR